MTLGSAYLSDVYPLLDYPRSEMRSDLSASQHRADHAGRHGVKLGDGGADGGGAVFVLLLIPLGPDGAQTVVRHHLLKQQLEQKKIYSTISVGTLRTDYAK